MCVCAPLLEAYWNDDHRGLDCRYAVLLLGLLDLLLVQRDPRGEKTKWGKKNKIKSKGTSLARPRTYSSPLSLSLPLTISHFHFPLLSLFSSFFFGFFFFDCSPHETCSFGGSSNFPLRDKRRSSDIYSLARCCRGR